MHSVHDYDVVVDSVATKIRESPNNKVILTVPLGSLRGKIVEKLMDSGFEILVRGSVQEDLRRVLQA